MAAITRIDAESQSVTTSLGVGNFSPLPTNEGIVGKEWEEHLSLQAVENLTANDTLEFRVPALAVGSGQCYVPAESYLKVDFHIQKAATATMESAFDSLDHIAPNIAWPQIGLFKRAALTYNNVPMNEVSDGLPQAEFVSSLVNRSRLDVATERATGGWAMDEYMGGGEACVSGIVSRLAADTSTSVITMSNANVQLANLEPMNAASGYQGSIRRFQKFRLKAVAVGGVTSQAQADDFNFMYEHQVFEVGRDLASGGDGAAADMTFSVKRSATLTAAPVGNTVANIQTYLNTFDQERGDRRLDTTIVTTAAGAGGPFEGSPSAGAMAGATNFAVHIMFESQPEDAYRALTRPGYRQPLGRNKGALQRRNHFLRGSNSEAANANQPSRYSTFSVAYRFPTIGAWNGCQYLPDGTQIGLKMVVNDMQRQFRDYSAGGAALANLQIKFDSCKLMMKRVTLNPNVDAAIQAQFAAGDTCKINCVQVAQYQQRFSGGARDFTLRSLLGSNGRPMRLLVWSALDSVTTGNVPRSLSTLDLNWDSSQPPAGNAALAAGANDVEQMFVVCNGTIYPARRLTQSTSALTALFPGELNGAQDYEQAFNALRAISASPEGPVLTDIDWRSIKVYATDLLLTDQPGIADPTQSSVNLEVHVQLQANTPVDPDGARVIGVTAFYQSQIHCDASRNYVNDMS